MSENQAEEQDEPTMEEILASIRRIISEDNDDSDGKPAEDGDGVNLDDAEAASDEGGPAEEPEPEPGTEKETETAEAAAEPEPEPEPEEKAEDSEEAEVLNLTEEMEAAPAEEPEDEALSAETPAEEPETKEPAPEPAKPDPLVESVTEEATRQSFDKLSALMVAGYSGSGNTLEGLVRDLLKPMIKAYLDENLPRIVDDVVEREIARISRHPVKK